MSNYNNVPQSVVTNLHLLAVKREMWKTIVVLEQTERSEVTGHINLFLAIMGMHTRAHTHNFTVISHTAIYAGVFNT